MIFEIGKVVPEFLNQTEGCKVSLDDSGLLILIFYNKPTPEEIGEFSSGKTLKFTTYYKEGVFFLLMKPGNESWMDMPYNPYFTKPALPVIDTGLGLATTIVLVDTSTAIPMSIRLVGLPEKLSNKIIEIIKEMYSRPGITADDQQELIDRSMMKYQTTDLLKIADYPVRI